MSRVIFNKNRWEYVGPPVLAMDDPTMRQLAFQFFNDDGTDETDSTTKAAINTDITGQNVDENFLIRFVIDENAGNANTNYTAQLTVRNELGAYVTCNGSSQFGRSFDSTKITDGNDTTQRTGSGSFLSTNAGQDDVNGKAGSAALDFVGNDETEMVFCVQIVGADVGEDDETDFRLDISDIDTYVVAHARVTSTGGTGGDELQAQAWM